mgnify:CR=1 FL=1
MNTDIDEKMINNDRIITVLYTLTKANDLLKHPRIPWIG